MLPKDENLAGAFGRPEYMPPGGGRTFKVRRKMYMWIDVLNDWLDTEIGQRVSDVVDSLIPGLMPRVRRKKVPVRVPAYPQYPQKRERGE